MSYLLRDLESRLGGMVARCRVRLASSDKSCQLLQLQLGDDPKSDVEHIEPFGFTSCPKEDAEAVALFVGGDRSHGLVLQVGDRRYRLPGLNGGEVAVYNADGAKIVLRNGRIIEVECDEYRVTCKRYQVTAETGVGFDTPLVQASHDIADRGGASTMSKMRDAYNGHDHQEHDVAGMTDPPKERM